MKTFTFNKVAMEMSRGNGYGQYYITSLYKGVNIKVHTTDSEAWDYCTDDSNKQKHRDAKRYCYYKVVAAYENR